MITEDYVSFETAKLLKEKGFNERLLTFYATDEAKKEGCFQIMAFTDDKIDNNHSDHCYLAPTLQMAMKWLREVYNVYIGTNPISGKGYNATIYDVADFDDYGIITDTECFFHAQEAVEAALKYCLENLI